MTTTRRTPFAAWLAIPLLLAACATPPASPPPPSATLEVQEAVPSTPTLPALPSPLAPTTAPTAAPPPGSLTLGGTFGYGSDIEYGRVGIRLSQDETRLIVPTSAGIFVFTADDLRPVLAVYEPLVRNGLPDVAGQLAISADGSVAVSLTYLANGDRVLRVWDLSSGTMLDEFVVVPAERSYVFGGDSQANIRDTALMTLSPDNRQVVLAFRDGLIWVVDLERRAVVADVATYADDDNEPILLEFDPEGNRLYYVYLWGAVYGQPNAFQLDATSWKEVGATYDVAFEAGGVSRRAAISPTRSDSGYIFGYFQGSTLRALEFFTGALRFRVNRPDSTSDAAFSRDGRTVVLAGVEPPELEVWEVDTTTSPELTFRAPGRLWSVAASSDGQAFFGITGDGTLYRWQPGTPDPTHAVDGFYRSLERMEFTSDGQTLRLFPVKQTIDNLPRYTEIRLEAASGELIDVFPDPVFMGRMEGKSVDALALSPDENLGAYLPIVPDRSVLLFNASTGNPLRKVITDYSARFLGFTSGEALLLVGNPPDPMQLLDIDTGEVLRQAAAPEELGGYVAGMLLSGDRSVFALQGYDPSGIQPNLFMVDAGSLETVASLEGFPPPASFALSHDGKRVAILTLEGEILMWDVVGDTLSTAYDLRMLHPRLWMPRLIAYEAALAFSPDGSHLALSTADGLLRLFEVAR